MSEQEVSERFNRLNSGNTSMLFEFNLFHYSVLQKLWSAQYYLKQLEQLDINKFLVVRIENQTSTSNAQVIPYAPLLDIDSYCRYLNLVLDGFFVNCMSTLDTIAHEIFFLYSSISLPSNIYIKTAKDQLNGRYTSAKLAIWLNNELNQSWYSIFQSYRHCTTHESLINYEDINVRYIQIESRYQLARRIRLPDNPKIRPYTYQQNRYAIQYCNNLFKKIEGFVSNVYKRVIADSRLNGKILPIP